MRTLFLPLFLFMLLGASTVAQNEASKWYFGKNVGLDFMTNPPTVLTGSTNADYCTASVADAAGNLLFYTDGSKVWNATHAVMANGLSLNGNPGLSQSAIIIKKPGSNSIYYIFTPSYAAATSFCYHTVDMTLAAGLGSVTAKNAPLLTNKKIEKVTATRHCNGSDVWIVTRDNVTNSSNVYFESFLVSAAGVNTTAVTSPAASSWTTTGGWSDYGCMKISPNGTKLGCAVYNWNSSTNNYHSNFEMYDFNASTGAVTNSLGLNPITWNPNYSGWLGSFGCEFSPDGTKFYGSTWDGGLNYPPSIFQWDLCAGNDSMIIASQYTVATGQFFINYNFFALQAAPDGKIYGARWRVPALDVINNPNAAGAACNFVAGGLSLATRTVNYGLPNFMTSVFAAPLLAPFTYTDNSCLTASFTAPASPTFACAAAATGDAVLNLVWDFGDFASGAANTSTLSTPVHLYPAPGTYTVKVKFFFNCGTDSLIQPVVINGTSFTINSASISCASLGSATVTASGGTGGYSYMWMPGAQTTSVATGLQPGTYSISVSDNNNCTATATAVFISPVPFTGIVNNSPSVTCNGVANGTAGISVAGGSGSSYYSWTNGALTETTAIVNNLAAGVYTVNVIDALTSCSLTQVFTITQPPALTFSISASISCASLGSATVTASGGTGGYSYMWMPGAQTASVATGLQPGTYSISVTDNGNCTATATAVFTPSVPYTGTVSNSPGVTCNGAANGTAGISVSGGSGSSYYSWTNGALTETTAIVNNLGAGVYTVTVIDALTSCSLTQVFTITQPPALTLSIAAGSPTTCTGAGISFTATNSGGTPFAAPGSGYTYTWTGGPGTNTYTGTEAVAGIYTYTVSSYDSQSCEAVNTVSVTFISTPALSVINASICLLETGTLTASGAGTYTWLPLAGSGATFTDTPAATTVYTVTGSMAGCTSAPTTGTITVKSLPSATVTSNSPVCSGQPLILNGSTGAAYAWSGPLLFSSSVQNPTINPAAPGNSGVYSLTLTGVNSCTATANATLTVYPTPTLTVLGATVCATKTLNLFSNTVPGATFLWSGPGAFTSSAQNPVIAAATVTMTGSYNLTVTSTEGCINTAVANALVIALPSPSISTADSLICAGESTTLSAVGASTYTWSTGVSGSTIMISPIVTTIYTLTGADVNGCENSAAFTQSVSLCTGLIEKTRTEGNVRIYPNPFSERIIVAYDGGSTIEVFNTLGTAVRKVTDGLAQQEIDLSDQPAGVYFIKVGSVIRKIVKE